MTDAFERGRAALIQARNGGFRDAALLQGALQNFQKAIREDACDYRACVGMAYLLFLIRSPVLAERFCRRALELHPGHDDALRLLQVLSAEPRSGDVWLDRRLQLDAEALEQELESWIYRQSQQLMSSPCYQVRPSERPESIANLQQLCQEMDEHGRWLECYLAWIDQELDTGRLRQQLQIFWQIQRRLHMHLQQSEQMLQLAVELRERNAQVQALLGGSGADTLAAMLEDLLDCCNAIADRLDAFENKGIQLGSLLSAYQRLTSLVEDLQEQLEDA